MFCLRNKEINFLFLGMSHISKDEEDIESQEDQGQCKRFECKIVNIFLSISFNICFGCSKEPSH